VFHFTVIIKEGLNGGVPITNIVGEKGSGEKVFGSDSK